MKNLMLCAIGHSHVLAGSGKKLSEVASPLPMATKTKKNHEKCNKYTNKQLKYKKRFRRQLFLFVFFYSSVKPRSSWLAPSKRVESLLALLLPLAPSWSKSL
jgi:hypothetical protein